MIAIYITLLLWPYGASILDAFNGHDASYIDVENIIIIIDSKGIRNADYPSIIK